MTVEQRGGRKRAKAELANLLAALRPFYRSLGDPESKVYLRKTMQWCERKYNEGATKNESGHRARGEGKEPGARERWRRSGAQMTRNMLRLTARQITGSSARLLTQERAHEEAVQEREEGRGRTHRSARGPRAGR